MDAAPPDLFASEGRDLAAGAFDYSALDAVDAREARAVVERYRGRSRAYVMDTGRDLFAMKARLGHGVFLTWVRAEMGLEPRTAQNFMQVSERFASKSEIVSHLPPAVLYQLAAPSTPEPVRASVLRRIEAGETLTPDTILDEVREARGQAKAAATVEREAAREAARRASLSDEQREEEDALRAKGEKGKAARERKAARDRAAWNEERRQEAARATEAAIVLVDMLGADRAATYFARFSRDASFQRAEEIAQLRRAKGVEPVEVHINEIRRSGSLWGNVTPEDRPRIEALARQIEQDGLTEPPIGVRRDHDRVHPVHILEGLDTVRAIEQILGWKAIPIRLVPPVVEGEAAAADGETVDEAPAADYAAAAQATGGRTTAVVRAIREAGLGGLGDAVDAHGNMQAPFWRAPAGAATGGQAERDRRGLITIEVADMVRRADQVATVLPDLVVQAIEERAWEERASASGAVLPALTPAEWIARPEGLGCPAGRIVTMLRFAVHAQDEPRRTELDLDKALGWKPGERRRRAQSTMEAFEALAGLAPRDA